MDNLAQTINGNCGNKLSRESRKKEGKSKNCKEVAWIRRTAKSLHFCLHHQRQFPQESIQRQALGPVHIIVHARQALGTEHILSRFLTLFPDGEGPSLFHIIGGSAHRTGTTGVW